MGGRTAHALDERGTVRDWLVTMPWAEPVTDLDRHLDADGDPFGPRGRWVLTNAPDASPLKAALYADHLIPDEPPPTPVEGEVLTWSGRQERWLRLHTESDGLVDFSAFCFTPQYRLALAGVMLEVDQAGRRELHVASTGPTAVFLGGRLVDRDDTVTYMEPAERRIPVQLPSGTTPVVIASWHVAFREVRQVVRLRVVGLPVRVVLLSPDADEHSAAVAEQVLADVGFLAQRLPRHRSARHEGSTWSSTLQPGSSG